MSDQLPIMPSVPFYRRLWFVVLMTVLMLTFPIAMILLLTGNVYRRRGETWVPMGRTARYIYGGVLALWFGALVVQAMFFPGAMKRNWDEGASPSSPTKQEAEAAAPNAPSTCDSSDAADTVKNSLENGPTSKIISTKVLDFGHAHELFFDKKANVRYCDADAELNTGTSKLSYKIYFGPSGSELVEVREGEDAFDTKSIIEAAASQIARQIMKIQAANQPSESGPSASAAPPQQSAPSDQGQEARDTSGTTSNSANDPQYVMDRYSDTFFKCMGSGEAAQGYSGGMIKCLNAEIDFQNAKYASAYHAIFNALDADKAASFRSQEMAWGGGLDKECEPAADNGQVDPVAKPHCVLRTTVEHTITLEKLLH